MLDAISKWREARAYKKICRLLVKRFGGPEWYSAGQVRKVIDETGAYHLKENARQVLANEGESSGSAIRLAFADKFLDGRNEFTARDVVKRFVGVTYYSRWKNPDQPRQDVLYGG